MCVELANDFNLYVAHVVRVPLPAAHTVSVSERTRGENKENGWEMSDDRGGGQADSKGHFAACRRVSHGAAPPIELVVRDKATSALQATSVPGSIQLKFPLHHFLPTLFAVADRRSWGQDFRDCQTNYRNVLYSVGAPLWA